MKETKEGGAQEDLIQKHLTTDEFVEKFVSSRTGLDLLEQVEAPQTEDGEFVRQIAATKYANSWWQSLKLLSQRELLLWWREKDKIKIKVMQSKCILSIPSVRSIFRSNRMRVVFSPGLIMGVVVGSLFFQQSNPNAIIGVLFQSAMYCTIGAMLLVVKQFPDRSIYYKQQDANFFPTWTYCAGRSFATVPTAFIDAIVFGTMIYWFVGLAFGDGASIGHYFIFLVLLFLMSLASGLLFSLFSACVANITIAQACMAVCTG